MGKKKALGDDPLKKKRGRSRKEAEGEKKFPLSIVGKKPEPVRASRERHSFRSYFEKTKEKNLEVAMEDFLNSKKNAVDKAERSREEIDKARKKSAIGKEKAQEISKKVVTKPQKEAHPGVMEEHLASKATEKEIEEPKKPEIKLKKAGIKPKKQEPPKKQKPKSKPIVKASVIKEKKKIFEDEEYLASKLKPVVKASTKKEKKDILEDSDEIQTTTFFKGFSSVFLGIGDLGKSALGLGADAGKMTGQFISNGVLLASRMTGKTVRMANQAALSTVDSLDHTVGPQAFKKKKIKKQLKSYSQREDELLHDLGKLYHESRDKPKKEVVEKLSSAIKKIHSQKNNLKKELSKT